MANTNSLRKGTAVKHENKLYFVQDSFFVSPGKGAAFYRVKLKEVVTGKVVEHTFKSGENIEVVDLERRNATFLYRQKGVAIFMDEANFEQYEVEEKTLTERVRAFLKEGEKIVMLFHGETPLEVTFTKTKLPFKVTVAPPAVKGDSVSSSYRPVTIETGATVQVPLFIREGDVILINVETGEYSERVKE